MDQPNILPASLSAAFAPGEVALVGAGPGDPGLLTLRAWSLLQQADAVVYDRLVSDDLMALLPAACSRHYAGKTSGYHSLPQPQINQLLVDLARQNKRVVRLKGGDPFIFGRGGEEAEACRAAGVPVQVVPGISSALGAAAAAQVPLTHRDHASIVSFVAGQCKGLTEQNWAGLAGKDRTLVIFMGVATAPQIAEKLMGDGLAPDTPVAVIEKATQSDMRVLRGPLAGLPDIVQRHRVRSPALIVIGAVTAAPDTTIRDLALSNGALEATQ